jgi:hypothetical protein
MFLVLIGTCEDSQKKDYILFCHTCNICSGCIGMHVISGTIKIYLAVLGLLSKCSLVAAAEFEGIKTCSTFLSSLLLPS